MKEQRSRVLRGGARAAAGVVVVGVAAAAVIIGLPLPTVERAPLAIAVDTTQDTGRTIACAGSFGVLGADPARPDVAIPVGVPAVTVAGTPSDTAVLTRATGGDGLPTVLSAPLTEPLAAAQIQGIVTDALRGTVASTCAEPLNEQWLLGGGSTVGISTSLELGNPGKVPATVQISVFDENGEVASGQTAGVIVQPGATQTVSLNGYAPNRGRLAVRVTSTGAPVVATLGIGQSLGLEPFAVSEVTRQQAPAQTLVIPGITNVSDQSHRDSDVGAGDAFPVLVRLLAPGSGVTNARVIAVDEHGKRTDLGEITLTADAVGELSVPAWPKGANAVVVEADAPVVGSVLSSATNGETHDYEWFTPAQEIAADKRVAVPVVAGGQLVLVNQGSTDAQVEISGSTGKPVKATVPGAAAVMVRAPADGVLVSSQPLYAGVRVVNGGDIAGYPILAPDPLAGTLTVFTR